MYKGTTTKIIFCVMDNVLCWYEIKLCNSAPNIHMLIYSKIEYKVIFVLETCIKYKNYNGSTMETGKHNNSYKLHPKSE